ncbi:MAG TPA: zinc ribbon domain-containing protein [Tahibacter sp.]|uniref:FmdB family zinc ribbon protein n=1 Tax=Tahibacter sp. TaxID=2056211 RepID=UPI002C5CBD88|nr:zinc ribbon domain-containing protein [Tahibacter sp.]HSX58802.1 zinc ribbon domain-containing protein [Tahibacter sp.]
MPIYEYIAQDRGCPRCEAGFDLLRKLSDADVVACPDCGAPVQRRISAPNTIIGNSHLTSEGHAAKHGFTQYRRAGGGVYEKTAGKGPDFISGD